MKKFKRSVTFNNNLIEQSGSFSCHARVAACAIIVKTPDIRVFVIPGLTRNPALFQIFTLLDAGSVIPDLIRDRHDDQKLVAFLNCDTVW